MTDRDELIRALRLLFVAGDVFEIRVLKAVTAGYQRPHTESGYFDYEHIPQAADAIARLRSYAGAYVTLNPVDPDLLARACNRIGPAEQNSTTSDADTVVRRWLPVDCDAVRKSNISSTDDEHETALSLAHDIRKGLAGLGWPEPVMLDSGNGAQMLFRIDLPAKDGGLVQKAIASIAEASTEKVRVDLTVYNPARIWRLPGTMNCKGDSIPTRPHRMAHIVSVPDTLECVTEEQLRDFTASSAQANSAETLQNFAADSTFSLDAWIAEHLPEPGSPVPYNGGRKWQLRVCPFNHEHDNGSAVLIEEPSGAVAFRCLHNSCAGNDWRKLREMLEPGCYDQPQEHPDVDLSGLLGKMENTASGQSEQSATTCSGDNVRIDMKSVQDGAALSTPEVMSYPDPGPLPERFVHMPGFVDDYAQWIMDTAPYPNRVLAFSASLAFLSFITGRSVRDERGNHTNLYYIALANPGTGKDHPRKCNSLLAMENQLQSCLADEFGSGEGLEDSLCIQPTMLYQVDEFDTLFNSLRQAKEGRGESIIEKMLRLYSSSNGLYRPRNLALRREDRNDLDKARQQAAGRCITNPHLVIFGTAVPKFFYQALSPRVLNNGLVARCLILDAGRRGHGHMPKSRPIPASVNDAISTYKGYGGSGNLDTLFPKQMEVKATPEAQTRLTEVNERLDTIYDGYEAAKESVAMTIWSRAFEKVCKLSLLYALSRCPANPEITLECVEWGSDFADYLTRQMLFLSSTYSYENDFDEKCQKIMRYLRECKEGCPHSVLLKRSHESKELFGKIIDTLKDNGSIVADRIDKGNRSIPVYRLKDA